jgi:hypothetical protein
VGEAELLGSEGSYNHPGVVYGDDRIDWSCSCEFDDGLRRLFGVLAVDGDEPLGLDQGQRLFGGHCHLDAQRLSGGKEVSGAI